MRVRAVLHKEGVMMSTRGSIIYWYLGWVQLHIYHECNDDRYYVEFRCFKATFNRRLSKFEEESVNFLCNPFRFINSLRRGRLKREGTRVREEVLKKISDQCFYENGPKVMYIDKDLLEEYKAGLGHAMFCNTELRCKI